MLCVFSVLVHHMHADVHASVCICMWVAACLPQSFVTVLKFTYLFLITFFFCVHFTCNGQRRTWGTPVLCVLGINSGGEVCQQRLFFPEPIVLGQGLSLSLELTE